MNDKKIYRLNDEISFRQCTLFYKKDTVHGDCTNFCESEENWKKYYSCNQYGIHLHCTKHPEIEFNIEHTYKTATAKCLKCSNHIVIYNYDETIKQCMRMLNIEEFKSAQLVRLDDWYFPELKKKEKIESEYWIVTDIKTDKDRDTIIIVYVGHVGTKDKTQFFIKPEKCQLTSDHKDLDPAKIISKIEITLKDRTLSQKYDESI
jgi:hypothetical protein